MSKHFQTKFVGDSKSYLFNLAWDDSRFEEGYIEFTVVVEIKNLDDDIRETHELKVSLEMDSEDSPPMFIVNYLKNDEKLRNLINIRFDEEFVAGQVIDEVINKISSAIGGPVTCLLGHGLTITISQLLECKNSTFGIPWYWRRIKEMGKCLKESFPGMCIKLAYRAVECMIHG